MSIQSKLLLTCLSAVAMVAISTSSHAATTSINFDGTGAPNNFIQTLPLTNFYAGQGVTFSGSGGNGGSILNQLGNFGFSARSGTDFLGFNDAAGTGLVQVLTFSSAISQVSIWANSGSQNQFSIEGFDANNGSLGSVNTGTFSEQWRELVFSAAGISSVRLTMAGDVGAYDDLSFTDDRQAVPEPGSLALVALGLVALALRKRQSK